MTTTTTPLAHRVRAALGTERRLMSAYDLALHLREPTARIRTALTTLQRAGWVQSVNIDPQGRILYRTHYRLKGPK